VAPRKSSKEAKTEQLGLDTSLPPEEGRQKALEATLTDLTKRFGDGTVMRLGDAQHMIVEVIPSGSLTVDIAVGVGGIPRGRVTEIYGPESSGKTTLCLHVIAEAQRRGGLAAFVDMEHALDPTYAARIGVNINSLYVAQPDTAEQALEITEAFVRSGAMDVVVLDSVAALVPRVEIEGEMGDSHVGIQARLMSQALRKLAGAIKSSNATVIFTNQLREKIGVMYGCFSYNAPVQLADGTTRTIGEIVNQKQPVEVLTYNHDTMQFEPKQVINWFKQGVPVDEFTLTDNQIGVMEDEFLTIVTTYPDASGHTKLTCTPNHEIATPTGYQMAGDLDLGDYIIARHDELCFSPDMDQFILGSLLGDGSLKHDAEHTAYFREEHHERQSEYVKWKHLVFGDLSRKLYQNPKRSSIGFETKPSSTLAQWKRLFYGEEGRYKRVTARALRMLTPFALAIWYMDDGTRPYNTNTRVNEICTHIMSVNEQDSIREIFAEKFELHPVVRISKNVTRIRFSSEESERFEQLVAPYIHPSMKHKLRGNFENVGSALTNLDFTYTEQETSIPVRVIEIRRKLLQGKRAVRYNLQVADNANYLVGSVVVHNSPETTSGGRALKFYASIRMESRKLESLKNSAGEVMGNRTRVRVTKNKVAPPFREAEFDIMFMEGGISKSGEILDLATELGIVEKRGAFYRYNDGLLGQGRDNAKTFLGENMPIRDEIEDAVRAHYGLPQLTR
jgi:recombination protein RecA